MSVTTREPQTDDGAHSWAETRAFHPRDRYLRDHKFTVRDRPRKGPDLWIRAGTLYTEEQALAIADEESLAAAGKRGTPPITKLK